MERASIMQTVGLVLGGGGARGFAHVGVIKAIEEFNVKPVAISGCSMGAIVGALAATGVTAEEIIHHIHEFKFTELLDVGSKEALNRGRGLEKVLSRYLPETFEDLSIPLKITACDIQKGVQVVFDQGDLRAAIRASISLPGVFPPARVNGKILLDGGMVNNLPVDIIRAMTHQPVIAIDVAAPPDRALDFEGAHSWWDTLITKKQIERPLIMEIVMKAYDIPQRLLTDARVALNPPDIFVRPPIDPEIKVEDFDEWEQPCEAGYSATKAALETEGHKIGL